MPHSCENLVFNEKSIKSHCKRLQKEMEKLGHPLTLPQSKNLFSRALGFKNFKMLQKTLLDQPIHCSNEMSNFEEIQNEILTMIKEMEPITDFIWFFKDGSISYLPFGVELKDGNEGFLFDQVFEPEEAHEKFNKIIDFFLKNKNIFNYNLISRGTMENSPTSWDHELLSWKMPFSQHNNSVERHITIQMYPSKNTNYIKFLIHYVNNEEVLSGSLPFSRKYSEIAHLLDTRK